MKKILMTIGLLWAGATMLPCLAQGVSEGFGKVVDRAGKPIQGALVTFHALSNPDVGYSGKTNKKGRYFVAGMFTGKSQERWNVKLEAEGYLPVEVRVESRTVNKVLVGDPMEAKLSVRKPAVPEFPIPALGKAQVDWVVVPASEAEAELKAQMAAAAAAGGAEGEAGQAAEGGEAAPPQKDPWVEALTLASDGALEESVEYFTKAVEERPEDAERHETFAKILFRLDRRDEAGQEALKAVELDPERVDSQLLLYSIHEGAGEMDKARAVLEAARRTAPTDTRVLNRLGAVLSKTGDIEGALAVYGSITEVDPSNGEAWLMMANIHADAGRLKESEAAYQKVVDLDPVNAYQTYYNLGASIIKRPNRSEQDTRRAIDAFRRACEIKPDYAKACQELAFAQIGVGDKNGALQTLETYVAANPGAPEASRMKSLIQTLQK